MQSSIEEWKSVYVRVCVAAEGRKAAKDCSVYLLAVEKKTDSGAFVAPIQDMDSLQLPWSHGIGIREVQIPHLVRRFADVLVISEKTNKLEIASVWPLRFRPLFATPGTFRLTVGVVGEGVTESVAFELDWNGKWYGLTLHEPQRAA